jgi:hypothetical protein
MIELNLLIVVRLLINNPNKECIVVPFINKVALSMCRNPTLAKCGGEAQHFGK